MPKMNKVWIFPIGLMLSSAIFAANVAGAASGTADGTVEFIGGSEPGSSGVAGGTTSNGIYIYGGDTGEGMSSVYTATQPIYRCEEGSLLITVPSSSREKTVKRCIAAGDLHDPIEVPTFLSGTPTLPCCNSVITPDGHLPKTNSIITIPDPPIGGGAP
jgi:hypothetical protein